jgi:hypothetical protein
MFYMGSGGAEYVSPIFVYAATSFVLADRGSQYSFGPKAVSATTGLVISYAAPVVANRLLPVAAATTVTVTCHASEVVRGPILVSATTAITVGFDLATQTHPGPRAVEATTNFTLAAPAKLARVAILVVSAQTSLVLGVSGAENASLNASARSDFSAAVSSRQNRDLYSTATTSLGLTLGPKTGNLKSDSALTTFTITVSASLAKTGTLAANGLVFTDLAQAVVWIPWRRTALSLPPGGNLPHS